MTNMKIQSNINYDICLWKHGKDVVMSPTGVVYLCNKCEKNKVPFGSSVSAKKTRTRKNRVRQNSSLVK